LLSRAEVGSESLIVMHDFIREIPSQDPTAAAALGVRIVRNDLTASELAAAQSFSVSLRMRNFAELESRIASPFG
jgi:hypothetical protein